MISGCIDDDAVSPVIGVILMVAITVIIASVVGMFVMNMEQEVDENVRAGVDISEDTRTLKVELIYNDNAEWVEVQSDALNGSNYTLERVGDSLVLRTDSNNSVLVSDLEPGDRLFVVGYRPGREGVVGTVITSKEVENRYSP